MFRRAVARAGVLTVVGGLLSLVGGAPSAAAAASLVVRPGESIQAAVNMARAGDTVVVLKGTYREAVYLVNDGVRLRGKGAVIKPPAALPRTPCSSPADVQTIGICVLAQLDPVTGAIVKRVSDVTVSGFRVEGFSTFGIGMLGGNNVDFVDNTTVNNTFYGIARFDSLGGTMRGNRATGSVEAGIYLGDSPGTNASIVDNVAWNNGLFGFLVRDSSLGKLVGNTAYHNCVGVMVLSTYAPTENWTVTDNVARNNTKACPATEGEFPAVSGVGIFLVGASHNKVVENTVTGNRATGPTLASGGVVVVSAKKLGGAPPANDPVGNLIKGNTARNNQPDLYYDGTGSGNRFVDNRCRTSTPAGLCRSGH